MVVLRTRGAVHDAQKLLHALVARDALVRQQHEAEVLVVEVKQGWVAAACRRLRVHGTGALAVQRRVLALQRLPHLQEPVGRGQLLHGRQLVLEHLPSHLLLHVLLLHEAKVARHASFKRVVLKVDGGGGGMQSNVGRRLFALECL